LYKCNRKPDDEERKWRTDHIYDNAPQPLNRLLMQLAEDVAVVDLKELKGDGQMMVLQHRFIVVH